MPLRYQEMHYLNQIAQNDSPVSIRATTISLSVYGPWFGWGTWSGCSVGYRHCLVLATADIMPHTVQSWLVNGVARTLKRLRTSKGDYWMKQWFSSVASLFRMWILKGKIFCALRGSKFFPLRAVPYGMEWKITFTTLGDLPWMLLFLLRTCVIGVTPMHAILRAALVDCRLNSLDNMVDVTALW